MTTMQARIVHISIDRSLAEVAVYLTDPRNMAEWASGLGSGLVPQGDDWVTSGGPLGEVHVRFAPRNDFGVADHEVTLPDGTRVHNALRAVPNGDGVEVMFTLLRMPGTTDEAFEADAAHIRKDLETLKALLERPA